MRESAVTTATTDGITLADLRDHCEITSLDENQKLLNYLKAARAKIEEDTGRKLNAQVRKQWFDSFHDPLRLKYEPVTTSATGITVKYVVSTGSTSTLGSSVWELGREHNRAVIRRKYNQSWPSGVRAHQDVVSVQYQTGYATIPPALKHAMRLLVGHWYENREVDQFDNPTGYDALIAPYRVMELR